MQLIFFEGFYFGKIWKKYGKTAVFPGGYTGLGIYHMGGYGRIGVYRVKTLSGLMTLSGLFIPLSVLDHLVS